MPPPSFWLAAFVFLIILFYFRHFLPFFLCLVAGWIPVERALSWSRKTTVSFHFFGGGGRFSFHAFMVDKQGRRWLMNGVIAVVGGFCQGDGCWLAMMSVLWCCEGRGWVVIISLRWYVSLFSVRRVVKFRFVLVWFMFRFDVRVRFAAAFRFAVAFRFVLGFATLRSEYRLVSSYIVLCSFVAFVSFCVYLSACLRFVFLCVS